MSRSHLKWVFHDQSSPSFKEFSYCGSLIVCFTGSKRSLGRLEEEWTTRGRMHVLLFSVEKIVSVAGGRTCRPHLKKTVYPAHVWILINKKMQIIMTFELWRFAPLVHQNAPIGQQTSSLVILSVALGWHNNKINLPLSFAFKRPETWWPRGDTTCWASCVFSTFLLLLIVVTTWGSWRKVHLTKRRL